MAEVKYIDQVEKEIELELLKRKRDGDKSDDGQHISGDGLMPDATQARLSVLVQLLTAIKEEKEYRQALLTGDFLDDDEADRVAAAIEERRRYGLSLLPIVDWVSARCGVNKAHGKSRVALSIEGLTHSTFTTQNRSYNLKQNKNAEED